MTIYFYQTIMIFPLFIPPPLPSYRANPQTTCAFVVLVDRHRSLAPVVRPVGYLSFSISRAVFLFASSATVHTQSFALSIFAFCSTHCVRFFYATEQNTNNQPPTPTFLICRSFPTAVGFPPFPQRSFRSWSSIECVWVSARLPTVTNGRARSLSFSPALTEPTT